MPDTAMSCHWCEQADALPLAVLCDDCRAVHGVARLYATPMGSDQARALIRARRAAEARGDLFAALAGYRRTVSAGRRGTRSRRG